MEQLIEREPGRLLKITFEYENETRTLSGRQAEYWLRDVDGMCSFMANHNANPFDVHTYEWDAVSVIQLGEKGN
jgi:hypothetical protein